MSKKMTSIKNILKNKSPYQWLWVLMAVWIITLVSIRLFVPFHGHRTWWAAIFHRKVVKSQVVSPVAMTDDNNARAALLDFYQKYTTTTDKAERQALVDKNSSAVFAKDYKNSTGLDAVTCSSEKISSVQIGTRILFNSDYTYRLIELTDQDQTTFAITTMVSIDGMYKIGNVICGQPV